MAGINHVQYNQGNDINAFAGMVSWNPWAIATPQTFYVCPTMHSAALQYAKPHYTSVESSL